MSIDRSTAIELRADEVTSAPRLARRISLSVIARWFAQLSVMLRAGIPLTQVLASMIETESQPRWRAVQVSLLSGMQHGIGFSASLQRHPNVFDALTVQLVATGEQTGQLDTVLAQIAQSLQRSVALRAQLRQALVYPICVLVVAVGIAVFMLLFVVPQFAVLFEANHASLPWLTARLIGASALLREHAVVACLATPVGVALIWQSRAMWLDSVVSRLPIADEIWLDAAIARWSSTLVLTLRAGLPFLQGLSLACATAQHPAFKRHASKWSYAIEEGTSLREALGDVDVFEPWALQMMAMGQESGQLDSMLERIGEFHLDAVHRTMAMLSTLLEPVVMIVIGAMVGTMLLAMYLPVFELSNAIG